MKFDMDAYVALAMDPDRAEREHFLGMSLVFAEMVAEGLGLKDYEVSGDEDHVSLTSKKVRFKLVQGIFDGVVCRGRKEEKSYGWRGMEIDPFLKFLKRLG